MEKIKKALNLKIILLIITSAFSFEPVSYAVPDTGYNKANLRVPMYYGNRRNNNASGAYSYTKVKVYYDEKAKIKRIAWDTIPEGLLKRLLKIIKEDARLRGKLFILGGACRDLFYGLRPSDIDCLPLEGSWKVFAENYLTENTLFEGIDVERTFADYIGEESVRYVDDRIKYGFGGMPDLSINHMLVGFDKDSDDPFIQDEENGLADLMNKVAKIGDKALFPKSEEFFLQRIITKIIKYDLVPTVETNNYILDIVKNIEREDNKQGEIRIVPASMQALLAIYKLWYDACGSKDFDLRQSIRQQFGFMDNAEPLVAVEQDNLPVISGSANLPRLCL